MNGSSQPHCPNHQINLQSCKDGLGTCPISGAIFSYEANEEEKARKLRLNALGQYETVSDWKVINIDGQDN